MPLALHPDIARAFADLAHNGPIAPTPLVGDVATRRKTTNTFFETMNRTMPTVPDVDTADFYATASDGHRVMCRWFKKTTDSPLPGSAILYAHGGGMISLSVDLFDTIIKNYVSQSGVPFLAVAYRLAPEHEAPTQVQDLYTGLEFLTDHAEELGVDINRIGIMGESAGGGLVASLAHYIKMSNGPKVARQILVYPMLDDRTTSASPEISNFLIWTADDNKTGWGALLGAKVNTGEVRPIHAAARMTKEDAEDLPTTYIDVGELDLFAGEAIEYVKKLGSAGVSCEFHLWQGLPHGFEGLAPHAEITKVAMEGRVRVLRSI